MVAHGMNYWLLKKPSGVDASSSKIIILGVIRRGTTGFTIQGLEIMFFFHGPIRDLGRYRHGDCFYFYKYSLRGGPLHVHFSFA